NPTALKELIGQTAVLEFRLVDVNADQNAVQRGEAPAGDVIMPYAQGGKVAVQRQVMISGDMLVDAKQSYDPQSGAPGVTLQLNGAGSKR
ncbi:SecDF P1 head subdomain-containing protein, partial [Enterococcus faecalis]|uniref:SecDF P1 head subdomain-containing protein n=2 Tax=Bacteria TaxID=2 RepID=UPI003CC5EE43